MVLLQEALAGHQAGARRQSQPCAALVHAQLDALGARIAHALYFYRATPREVQENHIAFHGSREQYAKTVQGHGTDYGRLKKKAPQLSGASLMSF
jgi:hypothetical protein